MSTNEPNKECHASNNDTLSNCLRIISSGIGANTKKNTHLSSSHGVAAARVRYIMDKRNLENELKEVWEH